MHLSPGFPWGSAAPAPDLAVRWNCKAGEVGRLLGLNGVHRVQHHHPLARGDLILLQLALLARAAEHPEATLLRHGQAPSLMSFIKSAGSGGCASRRTSMRSPSFLMTICSRAWRSSESG